jgi:nucleoid DNA-binding protein
MDVNVMKYSEFIDYLARKSNRSKKDTERFLNSFTDTMENLLEEGEEVVLPRFGKFKVKLIEEQEGKTGWGTTYHLPSHYRPQFKFSESMKNKLKEKT